MNDYIIRKSKLGDESYYIECNGRHKLVDISSFTGITKEKLEKMYKEHSGQYDDSKSLYYFSKYENCTDLIEALNKNSIVAKKVRNISLTEEEIEYIRRALINEDSNMIFTQGKIRESIFKKLNL